MSLVKVENLSIKTPTGKTLTRGVSFEVSENEILVIKGENGVGKTTLLRTLLKPKAKLSSYIDINVSKKKLDYLPQVQNSNFHII